MLRLDFPEIEIETTVAYYRYQFAIGKIPLPTEVELCPIGQEALGWRAYARRILKEAGERKLRQEVIVVN